jgi:hypothetical protein
MDAGAGVGHERRAGLRARQHRAQPAVAEAVDGIVEVLDVGAADTEDVVDAPVAQRGGERIRQDHAAPPGRQWTTAAAA